MRKGDELESKLECRRRGAFSPHSLAWAEAAASVRVASFAIIGSVDCVTRVERGGGGKNPLSPGMTEDAEARRGKELGGGRGEEEGPRREAVAAPPAECDELKEERNGRPSFVWDLPSPERP